MNRRSPSVFRLALPAVQHPGDDLPPDGRSAEAVLREADRLGVLPAVLSALLQAGCAPSGDGHKCSLRANLAHNLFLKAEQEPVLRQLRDAGVPCLPLRGVALTERLYPDLSWRAIADIDVLIRPDDVAAAYRALKSYGMTDAENAWNANALEQLRQRAAFHYPELRLTSPRGVPIELHWDWVEASLPSDDPCAVPEAYLVYLCRHAGKHFWSDLRWLTDIELFLREFDSKLDWGRIWTVARANNAERPCAATFHLCARLFGRELRPELRRSSQRAAKRLARGAETWLIEGKKHPLWDRPVTQLMRVDTVMNRVRRIMSWLAPAPRHWTRPDGSTPSAIEVWLSRYRRFVFLGAAALCPLEMWRRRLRKASELSTSEWALLARAWLLLPAMAVAIRTVRFPRLHGWAGRVHQSVTAATPAVAACRAADLVNAAARFHLIRLSCLPRSLALLRLLSRRGIAAELKMGVRRENGDILGHAWIEYEGQPINDADHPAERFAVFLRASDRAAFDAVASSPPRIVLPE